MMTPLKTERLTIREFTHNDVEFHLILMNTPLYIQNIGDRSIRTIVDADAYSRKIIASYKSNGYGQYAVVLGNTETVIGMSGLIRRDNLPHPDIGFGFLPEYMGKGYALEASQAVLKYAKNELKLHQILGITNPENKPSINLLKKLGLVFEKAITWGEESEPALLLSNQPH
ncbi:GNAT family N-acetyltransferase [Shewanella sp. 3_MG-2023]|uniref:GNAT family N-acetyltransferase n=1 Tax=Shewanella sp. 3_MG-2023 TaxID=3062635 RepID=UPI0026E3E301|nr:GNAT family N-acetyltransferase [Shewanella sp. 3_MG-2023]MDO6774905.1 GNAT family N-acetyltransferase [Shewanella sp. 3_MG-2023]